MSTNPAEPAGKPEAATLQEKALAIIAAAFDPSARPAKLQLTGVNNTQFPNGVALPPNQATELAGAVRDQLRTLMPVGGPQVGERYDPNFRAETPDGKSKIAPRQIVTIQGPANDAIANAVKAAKALPQGFYCCQGAGLGRK
jgi:hypothetical protein